MGDDLLEILQYLPGREDEALAQPRFRTREFCLRLIKWIDEVRLADPGAALAPARLAIRLAARLSDSAFGQAWAVWASVHRALSNYDRAELGHQIAGLYLDDPVDLARFHRRQAYLLRDQCKFAEARQLIGQAISMYLAAGDSHSRGCALVDLGTVYFAQGEFNEAVLRTSEALKYLDQHRDPEYHDAAVHNLALYLAHCDEPRAQLEVALRKLRQKRYTPGTLAWAKYRWLEGLIFKRRERYERAELTLRGARNQLLELGAIHDAGLVTMEMAEIYLQLGQWEKSARMARELFPVFRALKVDRETMAAFRLYVKAAVGHTLTQAQIHQLRQTFRDLSKAGKLRP